MSNRVITSTAAAVWNHTNVAQEDRSAKAPPCFVRTEDEVFAAAFDDEGWENDPATAGSAQADDRQANDDLIEQQSQITGFNGEPLGLDEIAAVNMYGHGDTDRPIEAETVAELEDELRAERSTVARLTNNGVDEIPMMIDRQRYQAREAAKKQLVDQGLFLDLDPEKETAFLDAQEAQNLKMQVMEGKLRYGDEFDEAFQHLTSLNAHDPRNRAVARTICFAPYGGGHMADTLVAWHRGQQGGGRRSQQNAPPSRQRGRSMDQDLYEGPTGVSSAAEEADIFADAFRGIEPMRYVFEPRDGEPRGFIPGIYSGHDRLLIPARLTHTKHPDVTRVFEPNEPFDVDEALDPDLLDFVRSHNSFKLVTRDWLRDHRPHELQKEF